jgi:hypothetical protein
MSLDLRLIDCPERQVGVWLPVPISARLDALARIGYRAWAPTTRKEVVSALLLDARADSKWLRAVLERFSRALVADALVPGEQEWRFLYPPGSPGPRRQLALDEALEQPSEAPFAEPGEPLPLARAYRIGMLVASPLSGRLSLLVTVARDSGIRTNRKDVLAALVLASPTEGRKLAVALERYWHGTVSDALIPGLSEDPVRNVD